MFKRFLYTILICVSVFAAGDLTIDARGTECEHYFIEVTIGDQRYLYEYSCDGTLVAVTEIED
jgi:hypothetical protein